MLVLQDITTLLGLQIAGIENIKISKVVLDSRKVTPGSLFVAISGAKVDGHDFILDAIESGAVGILCSKPFVHDMAVCICVPDTVKALGKIASMHRDKFSFPVLALTGSNGKTTVKDMMAAILGDTAFVSQGNLNSQFGLPLSILQVSLHTNIKYSVFELGTNSPGDIAYLSDIIKPKIALINNIALAHAEGLKSLDGIANEKADIYRVLPDDGIAIINADDNYCAYFEKICAGKTIIKYALTAGPNIDVYTQDLSFDANACPQFTLHTPEGSAQVKLKVVGEHNVKNALAAAAGMYALGIKAASTAAGLMRFTGVPGRMEVLHAKNGSYIINDTYNANAESVHQGLKVLAKYSGIKILVFGGMGELGDHSPEQHALVGSLAHDLGIDKVFVLGSNAGVVAQAFGPNAQVYLDKDSLVQDLLPYLTTNAAILVKGSRISSMETIVWEIMEQACFTG
jgi:UDP-N-acetylmuramoyl-tripeptide--D-alanyl-D-alanine ligase